MNILKRVKELNRHLTEEDTQMVNKRIERSSTLYITRERGIKRAMRYHCTHIRMAKIQNTDIPNAGEDVRKQKLSFIDDRNAK